MKPEHEQQIREIEKSWTREALGVLERDMKLARMLDRMLSLEVELIESQPPPKILRAQ